MSAQERRAPDGEQRTGWLHIRAYCTCGSKLDARSEPPDAAEFMHEQFRSMHSGDGHAPCDAKTARTTRARRALPSSEVVDG